jgi:hypothetical protein
MKFTAQRFWFSAALFAGSTPALAGPVEAFINRPPAEAAGMIANLCADQGTTVAEQDQFHVLCSGQMTGLKGALAQALIGNSYSTTPERKVRFSLIPQTQLGISFTRIQAAEWIETQMAFGQTRRQPLDNSKNDLALLNALISAGATKNPPQPQVAPPTPTSYPPPRLGNDNPLPLTNPHQ